MSIAIKICGLKTQEALEAALGAGADMVGVVFFEKSPRNIDHATAAALAERARGRALVAALTVDADDAALAAIVETVRPDLLQLHGHESAERVAAIRARFGVPVMKAVGIASPADVAAARGFEPVADRLLLDAKAPPQALHPGGNGLVFDWNLIADASPKLDRVKPFMLSGGLTPENVAEALAITHAPGVDVSSGVESAPGVKDPARIVAFIQAARAAAGDGAPRRNASPPAETRAANETRRAEAS
ncbi:phosphoribosylanthranilate isomerase [Bosea sp. 117]|uniref:phosphoribosylanthranilate isomerase n=1 Tax=Bosea sp. 117 TaxID=1125973 RepID=UPI000494B4FD|nr:phosphoribosylanthranilate isomerase [Bosea sp. 117]